MKLVLQVLEALLEMSASVLLERIVNGLVPLNVVQAVNTTAASATVCVLARLERWRRSRAGIRFKFARVLAQAKRIGRRGGCG